MDPLIIQLSLGQPDTAKALIALIEVDPDEARKALLWLREIRRNLTNDQIRFAFEITCEHDATRFLLMILNKEVPFNDVPKL